MFTHTVGWPNAWPQQDPWCLSSPTPPLFPPAPIRTRHTRRCAHAPIRETYVDAHTHPETCSDGVRNQDEEDVDCGGTFCGSCECTFIHLDDDTDAKLVFGEDFATAPRILRTPDGLDFSPA